MIDMHTKERKIHAFDSLPDEIRYKPKVVRCNDGERTIMIPVAEIRMSASDATGAPAPAYKAPSLAISYFDKDGRQLYTVLMNSPRK